MRGILITRRVFPEVVSQLRARAQDVHHATLGICSASQAIRRRMCVTAEANLTAVLEGREPPNPVN